MDLNNIKIYKNQYGKPYILGLEFNFSHDGEYIVLYAHSSCAVGVDVTVIQSLDFCKGIIPMLSPTDQEWILNQSLWNIPTKTHIIWAIKEAFCKMKGTGLDLEWLSQCQVNFISEKEAMIENTHILFQMLDNAIIAYTLNHSIMPQIMFISPILFCDLRKKFQCYPLF